jgi:hypothetical protein
LKDLQEIKIITTKEGMDFGENETAQLPKSKEEELLLNCIKCAEYLPVIVSTSSLPNYLEGVSIEISLEEMEEFLQNFIYDLNLVSNSPIQLLHSKLTEFFVFRTPLIFIKSIM